MRAALDDAGVVEQDPALRQAAGQAFYNTSRFTATVVGWTEYDGAVHRAYGGGMQFRLVRLNHHFS